MFLFVLDWEGMFVPSLNILETFLRGTLMYLFLFAVMRIRRREAGELSIADFLVVVIIADAAQNAMSADYTSITDGMILVATIALWDYILIWLGYRFPAVHRILQSKPLLLIRDGRMIRNNMRSELITEEDLISKLREHGIERLSEVRRCYLEGEGQISVIKRKSSGDDDEGAGRKKM